MMDYYVQHHTIYREREMNMKTLTTVIADNLDKMDSDALSTLALMTIRKNYSPELLALHLDTSRGYAYELFTELEEFGLAHRSQDGWNVEPDVEKFEEILSAM